MQPRASLFIRNSSCNTCLALILFPHSKQSMIRRKIFEIFPVFQQYIIFGEIPIASSIACWLTCFMSGIVVFCTWLWLAIDVIYWQKFRVKSEPGEPSHRLKVNVFVTMTFLLFCGGIAITMK